MAAKNSSFVTLDEQSLAMLLDEVTAMVKSGRPLASSLTELGELSQGNLARAAGNVRSSVEKGNSLSDAVASLSTTYRAPIRVAMEVMAGSGSSEAVYEAARLIREDHAQKRQLCVASINPFLNVIVAAGIAFFVLPWIVVSLSEAELIRDAMSPTAIEISRDFSKKFWTTSLITIVVVGIFLTAVYLLVTSASRGANLFRQHATFCRWLGMLVEAPVVPGTAETIGLDSGRLIESSSEVVGPEFASTWKGVAENVRGGATKADSLAFPAETPEPVRECVLDLVNGTRDSSSVANDLRRLGELYDQTASSKRTWWTEFVPRWLSWALMLGIMAVLLRAILIPLLSLVRETVQ